MTSRYAYHRSLIRQAIAVVCLGFAVTSTAFAADGKAEISKQQYEARQTKRFLQADADGNGMVSQQEFDTHRAAAQADKRAKRFARMDANKDGSIDAKELNAVLDRRFDRLDRDKNGALSSDERPGRKKNG